MSTTSDAILDSLPVLPERRINRQVNGHAGLAFRDFLAFLTNWFGLGLLVSVRTYEAPFAVDPEDGVAGKIPTQESLFCQSLRVHRLPDAETFPEERYPGLWAEARGRRAAEVQTVLLVEARATAVFLRYQERWVETLGTESTRPQWKVVCPAEWSDQDLKDAFRPASKQWVGYLFPPGQSGSTSKEFPFAGALWINLHPAQMHALVERGQERQLADSELHRLVELFGTASGDDALVYREIRAALETERDRRARERNTPANLRESPVGSPD